MAQHRGKQGEWPIVKREPNAWVLKPDAYERTERALAGPLRSGTSTVHPVGPRGIVAVGESRTTDFGTDRVSPREFDPMGTSSSRNEQKRYPSELVARKRQD
jgi:hypothetical protein